MKNMPEAQFDRVNNPCRRDCPERSPKCHGACERYAEYSRNRNAINSEKYKQKQTMAYIVEAVHRNKKNVSGKYKGKDYEE